MNTPDWSDQHNISATGGGRNRGRRHGTRALCLFASVAASLAASVIPPAANADEPEDADESEQRPPVEELFQTGLVYPQERGEVQLTLMPSYRRGDDGRTFSLGTEMEYGLTDAWQIGLEWEALVHQRPKHEDSTTGIGDLELSTQYSFMNLGGRPLHAALAFEFGLPTGDVDRDLGEGALEYTPSAALAWQIPAWSDLTLVANAGLSFVQRVRESGDEEDESAAHEYFLSGGAVLPLDRFAVSLECTWSDNTWNHDGDEQALYLTPGVHWLPGDGWQVGAGISFGLNRRADDYQLRFLLIREF